MGNGFLYRVTYGGFFGVATKVAEKICCKGCILGVWGVQGFYSFCAKHLRRN